ncbi:serine/threonine-protein kinase [Actinophytocola sp.]|uniref:serine/threonine-protein kinase n=1 Tax=Actinophytocola sp. TaxID=1872138 RepID=UPI002ED46D03
MGSRLGRGGMADVFEAWDTRLGRQVAIKRFRETPYGIGLRRFLAEAEMLGGLSHPGLLTVFDVSFDGERPFLVLRLTKGGTLRDRLDTGPLLPERVAEIGAAIADVLTYVHEHRIVHRDIKPSNILFDEDGECYLADFGIARSLDADRVTDSHEFVGTAAYLAPEQVSASSPGPAADVYSLGLALLESLTGEPEYTGTDVEVALARLSRPPRVPNTWGPEWRAVLSAMLDSNPTARPDAARCVELLRALQKGQTVPMVVPVRRAPRVYAGVATLAAAVAGIFVLGAGPEPLTGEPTVDPAQVIREPEQQAPVEPPAPPPPTTQPSSAQPPPTAQEEQAGEKSGKGKSKEDKGKGKSGKG